VLVNNAGTGTRRRQTTVDGYERTFAINHLAPFCSDLLLERLKASKQRVVTVSSMAHRNVTLDFDDLNFEKRPYSGLRAWRVEAREHPVRSSSRAGSPAATLPRLPASRRGRDEHFRRIWRPHQKNLQRAVPAVHAVTRERREDERHLASSPEVAKVTGKFFDKCREVPPAPAAQDTATAKRLWEISAKLTGLSA
jgi:hypothetical protein